MTKKRRRRTLSPKTSRRVSSIPKYSRRSYSTLRQWGLNLLVIGSFGFMLYLVFFSITQRTKELSDTQVEESDESFFGDVERIIQVEVLNGCGITGIAAEVGEFLHSKGFDVVKISDFESYNMPNSLVIDRVGIWDFASKVANAMGTDAVIQQVAPELLLDVSVIIGNDYQKLSPFNLQ